MNPRSFAFPVIFVTLYTFVGKTFSFILYLIKMGPTIENIFMVHLPNLIAMLACVYLLLRNNIDLKAFKLPAIACFIYATIFQTRMISGGILPEIDFVNPGKVGVLTDLPDLFAVLIMLYLVYFLLRGKKQEKAF